MPTTPTLLVSHQFATTMSSFPSALTSAILIDCAMYPPDPYVTAGRKLTPLGSVAAEAAFSACDLDGETCCVLPTPGSGAKASPCASVLAGMGTAGDFADGRMSFC